MRFTSQLSLQVITEFGDYIVVRLHLPQFIWMKHGTRGGLDHTVEPVFYVDDMPPLTDLTQIHLLRGATEAACEEAWSIYEDLVANGIPEAVVSQLLPVNLMSWGTVTFTRSELKDFVVAHHESPVKELALLAQGYERALGHAD